MKPLNSVTVVTEVSAIQHLVAHITKSWMSLNLVICVTTFTGIYNLRREIMILLTDDQN